VAAGADRVGLASSFTKATEDKSEARSAKG
jgi:hypothetical protein